ncbi:hypothetical protein ACFOWM_13885 [Ferruginibacter yonginensis]|uniref:Uncharacterized protein n=1 Tax=Ferruginibacter yonginensis TaxID=1310416 RepID=A0ABV8QUL8_9BACT
MIKNYPFKYEFVEKEELFNSKSKYADLKTYKYVLVGSSKSKNALVVLGKPAITAFYFFDREKNQNLQQTNVFESQYVYAIFKLVIKEILKTKSINNTKIKK